MWKKIVEKWDSFNNEINKVIDKKFNRNTLNNPRSDKSQEKIHSLLMDDYKQKLTSGSCCLKEDFCPFTGQINYIITSYQSFLSHNEESQLSASITHEEYKYLLPYGLRKDEEGTHMDDFLENEF